jgi:hypothetical protein
MTRYLITFEVESNFYQEAYKDGIAMAQLLEELEFDLQDQLEEYDLQKLLTRLVFSEDQEDLIIFAPKKRYCGE